MRPACSRGDAVPSGADLNNTRRRTIAACVLLLLSAALALAAFVLPGRTSPNPEAADSPVMPTVVPFSEPSDADPLRPLPHPSRPTALVIPALGVRAAVEPLVAEGKVLTPPGDVSQVGWWEAGRRPGSRRGHVLITGHTVHTGGGVFDNLGDLRLDDQIEVDTRTGPVVYRVIEVRYLSVRGLANESASLFAQEGPSRLVLVTCAGWDGAQYAYHGNTVVIARPMVTVGHAGRRAHAHATRTTASSSASGSADTVTPDASSSLSEPTGSPSTPSLTPSPPPPGMPYWYPCAVCELTPDRSRVVR